MKYFHGGAPGLKVGDLLRPAISLGKEHGRSPNQPNYSPHRVYLTRARWYADLFAHMGDGDVYEVRPVGRAVPDPDARGSFTCSCATVTAVLAQHPVELPEQARALRRGALRRPGAVALGL
ncbi:hypothetical protein [Streptacidiphilus carbonis]|uniref:hypothetical protein n=1 Tax=Streptacidiphilus carbonis TaxID=105422 RepID=UPI0006940EE1|nr:hypothetical protein [Streptacidiphilus carbonis]